MCAVFSALINDIRISLILNHVHSRKQIWPQAKGKDESMNVSEINSSQEGMEEVYENRLGQQEKAGSRSGTAATTEKTHQVTGTMVRARTQPSKTFFENTHPQRNELTVLKLEEEQRVIVKSRATGQAETSWGRRWRERKIKHEEIQNGGDNTGRKHSRIGRRHRIRP
jgi:hypothetical protein